MAVLVLFLLVSSEVRQGDEKVEQKPSSNCNMAIEVHILHELWRGKTEL